jgi:hypothetical protein
MSKTEHIILILAVAALIFLYLLYKMLQTLGQSFADWFQGLLSAPGATISQFLNYVSGQTSTPGTFIAGDEGNGDGGLD